MKIGNIGEVNDFLAAVDECKHDVYLKSQFGDCYNLKSKLSQYVGIAALLGEHGDELELFCSTHDDEAIMLNFLATHPEVR